MNRHSMKENIETTYKHLKKCSTLFIFRDMKTNPQWDTTSHLLRWWKIKRMIIPSFGKDVEEMEHWYTAFGNVKWHKHFGRLFGWILKYYTYTYHYHPLLFINSREMKACIHTKTYPNDHSTFFLKPKLETSQISIVRWMDK